MEEQANGVYTYCRKSTQYSTWSRTCFMTGEQCSKQSVVHKERKRLHDKNHINAFVVMNFSDMSDVVYKWKLRSFIESLKDYLYLNHETGEIICVANSKDDPNTLEENTGIWTRVEKIHVVRADSNTASNYIICNRVCQQMQIADLVIVDVSVENTNVFYEFGMATSFGKLILPICFNESFYQMRVPKKAQEYMAEKASQPLDLKYNHFSGQKNQSLTNVPGLNVKLLKNNQLREMIEHHIDCYPWRRKLFEYYGIRYRSKNSGVGYTNFNDIIDPVLGFSDIQYNQFPYDAKLENGKKVGEALYGRLANSYNNTVNNQTDSNDRSLYNTVVIYTMDSILNEEQSGQCIINFYRNMTSQIWEEFCFCGDRVGIMGQPNAIPDDPKDSKTDQKLFYRVGDIIRIGMNEATHVAQRHRIKTGDYLLGERDEINPKTAAELKIPAAWGNEAIRFTKEHVRNRCIPIYPDEPIYVQELLTGVQKGILSDEMLAQKKKNNGLDYEHFFCLFHITLHTLRYTNEIVVDLSRNSLQALFWLGIAHGRNTQAITVRHTPTLEELRLSGTSELPVERNIFDVAGLWTAILHSNNTDGFYNQLAMTQVGIEQHNKLTLPEAETEHDKEKVLDEFFEASPYMKFGYERLLARANELEEKKKTEDKNGVKTPELYKEMYDMLKHLYSNHRMKAIWKTLATRNRKESERLESYYRSLFWKRMLRYNELQLYTTQRDGSDRETHDPRRVSITWDMDAAAELSHYLSKRTTIGRYRIHALQEKRTDDKAHEGNFICIGGETVPMAKTDTGGGPLVRHIRKRVTADENTGQNVVHHMAIWERNCSPTSPKSLSFRGFFSAGGKHNIFAQFPNAHCTGNLVIDGKRSEQGPCSVFASDAPAGYIPNRKFFDTVTANPDWIETGKGTFCSADSTTYPCQLHKNKEDSYEQLAQLILWREVPKNPKDQRNHVKYWVSLMGVSGPATLALTSLLVDDQQKRDLFGWPGEKEKPAALPLNELQTEIRKTLMAHYEEALKQQLTKAEKPTKVDGDPSKETGTPEWFGKACYATKLYLSTVLYQYFFPFLSIADEARICNGMSAYVSSGGFMDMFDKKHYHIITESVANALHQTISRLRGVEALYRVEVKYGNDGKDDRQAKNIHLQCREERPGDGGPPLVSCLFTGK